MRIMMKVEIPVDAGNKAIQDNKIADILGNVFGNIQPEAAYFGVDDGMRTGWVVFDLKDESQIPVIAEPLFQGLDARLSWTPVMTQDDLQSGLQQFATGAA